MSLRHHDYRSPRMENVRCYWQCCGKERRKMRWASQDKLKRSFLALIICSSVKVGYLFKHCFFQTEWWDWSSLSDSKKILPLNEVCRSCISQKKQAANLFWTNKEYIRQIFPEYLWFPFNIITFKCSQEMGVLFFTASD